LFAAAADRAGIPALRNYIDCCLPVRPMRRPQVVKTFF